MVGAISTTQHPAIWRDVEGDRRRVEIFQASVDGEPEMLEMEL